MIPKLKHSSNTASMYVSFLRQLEAKGFRGDIHTELGHRSVAATDNSIYQMLPQALVCPQDAHDLQILTALSAQKEFDSLVLSPRGGGTGTNAQSLTDGIVVDLSIHMNKILEINVEEGWVRVQAGVVKDQLNHYLKQHELFFAPDLSTSNRATIGGMINTDASGQGSCLYGKTRDHVIELSSVLMDGTRLHTRALSSKEHDAKSALQNREGLAYRQVADIHERRQADIERIFPKLNRCLTGYDLAHIKDEHGRINLNNILCGSEGTLGFVYEAKLNLLRIPKYIALAIVKYGDFQSSLRDATFLIRAKPTSIETIDSKVFNLAMEDYIWQQVEEFFAEDTSMPVQGINLVEFTAQTASELDAKLENFRHLMSQKDEDGREEDHRRLAYNIAMGKDAVNKIWAMRKRAVGLLGNMQGEARPIPFVEDTAVPPENLADFIAEFREILDSYNLDYGMFGHVDAGVLHVRPALDLKDPEQEKIAWEISDRVADLAYQYHGLLWGEHGKGVRSSYSPKFFGDLYPELQKIKAVFDPYNQLNPGKIATPSQKQQLLSIEKVGTRGQYDRLISSTAWQQYNSAVFCNGNGACYNWDTHDAMCPSWKGTRERRYSPKGRAMLIRSWIRMLGDAGFDFSKASYYESGISKLLRSPIKALNGLTALWHARNKSSSRVLESQQFQDDFSLEVYDSMAACLACKACSGQCPIKVDVPDFRSRFLALFHTRYPRPLKDHLVGSLEALLPVMAKFPGIYNALLANKLVANMLESVVGFVDGPALSKKQLHSYSDIEIARPNLIADMSEEEKQKAVVIVQDAFTSHFEAELIVDLFKFLRVLGYRPLLAPFRPNGKALHVHGFLSSFEKAVRKQTLFLQKYMRSGVDLVGVDPSMTLTYRSEYKKFSNGLATPHVQLLQEWLAKKLESSDDKAHLFESKSFHLMPHCTEKTNATESSAQWQSVFTSLGQTLEVANLGCCGMAGTYGHETRNRKTSRKIYALSWQETVDTIDVDSLIATGYSCRSQIKRESQHRVIHPVQALLKQYQVRKNELKHLDT